MSCIYLATGERFGRVDDLEAAEPVWALEGSGAQCLAVDPEDGDVVYVGCRGEGLLRTRDGGQTWEALELPERDVFSVAVSAADGTVYVGTEPSRLFASSDGERFEELTGLQEIPSRERWSFPPRPWTSHVRWIAPDPHDAARLLVGIELCGLMLSEDGARRSPTIGPAPSRTSARWPGTRPPQVARTKQAVGGRRGAMTAAAAGSRPTPDATCTTSGRWRPIRRIRIAGSCPPRRDPAHTAAATPGRRCTAGTAQGRGGG